MVWSTSIRDRVVGSRSWPLALASTLGVMILLVLSLSACVSDAPATPNIPAPTVRAVEPANDSIKVAPDSPVSITFSVPIDAATAAGGAFEVRDAANKRVTGTLKVTGLGVVFTPAAPLEFNTRYTATVATTLKDVNGKALAAPQEWHFTTAQRPNLKLFAGNLDGPGNTDGTASLARFSGAKGVAVDASGNLYVADTDNHVIRKISSAGIVSTFAGKAGRHGSANGVGTEARFQNPADLAVDVNGNIYVADTGNLIIRKITPAGAVTTFAGTAGVQGSADGVGASEARFDQPHGIAVDAAGNVYVADTGNSTVRKIDINGVVSTLAGEAGKPDSNDGGTGTPAHFFNPQDVAVDADGNVFVADTGNSTVRKIDSTGVVSTYAGVPGDNGVTDGASYEARFDNPVALVVKGGNVYVSDTGNSVVRKIDASGAVTTLVGKAGVFGSADGSAAEARVNAPSGIAVDADGAFYLADTGNNTVRKITAAGAVSTLAGIAGLDGSTNATGAAARFLAPNGLAVIATHTVAATDTTQVYVADTGNHVIRVISSAGAVSTLAGLVGEESHTDGAGTAARFSQPMGVAAEPSGSLLVADAGNQMIRRVTVAGGVTFFAGEPGEAGTANGAGGQARFNAPQAVAVDPDGNAYVADRYNFTIRKVTPAGEVSTFAGSAGVQGFADGSAADARFDSPQGIATDSVGNVYVADTGNHIIRKITSAGVVSTLAGAAQSAGSTDATGVEARFLSPTSVVVDASGNVYVADTGNHTIRKITRAGIVTTVAGTAGEAGFVDGTWPGLLSSPMGLAIDGRTLYISFYNGVAVLENLP